MKMPYWREPSPRPDWPTGGRLLTFCHAINSQRCQDADERRGLNC